MKFSLEKYRAAVAEYEVNWWAIDDELYDLCRRHPGHSTPLGVNAKLWIIGRTYATGIERKIATKGTQGSSLTQLSKHLLLNSSWLEQLFEEFNAISEPLTPAKLAIIVSCHGRLLRLLKSITRGEQSARSFVSKYLHFHCSAVPIFDSYVAGVLPKFVRWDSTLSVFDIPEDGDKAYAWYVMRFWNLYQTAAAAFFVSNVLKEEKEVKVKVKQLDYYLICSASEQSSQAEIL